MNCDGARSRMVDFVYPEEPSPGRPDFEEHLARCASCREELEDYRRILAAHAGRRVPDPPVHIVDRILRESRERTSRKAGGPPWFQYRFAVSAAAAALVLVAIGATVIFRFGGIQLASKHSDRSEVAMPGELHDQAAAPRNEKLRQGAPEAGAKAKEPRFAGADEDARKLDLAAPTEVQPSTAPKAVEPANGLRKGNVDEREALRSVRSKDVAAERAGGTAADFETKRDRAVDKTAAVVPATAPAPAEPSSSGSPGRTGEDVGGVVGGIQGGVEGGVEGRETAGGQPAPAPETEGVASAPKEEIAMVETFEADIAPLNGAKGPERRLDLKTERPADAISVHAGPTGQVPTETGRTAPVQASAGAASTTGFRTQTSAVEQRDAKKQGETAANEPAPEGARPLAAPGKPSAPDQVLENARSFFKFGSWAPAAELFRQHLKDYPSNASLEIYLDLAVCYARLDDLVRANETWDLARQRFPARAKEIHNAEKRESNQARRRSRG